MNYFIYSLQSYATFKGRARRSEFWYFSIFNFLFLILFAAIDSILNSEFLFFILYYLICLVPALAVGVRRMHDVGKSGWFFLVPVFGFVLTLMEGETGDNIYGDDPKVKSK